MLILLLRFELSKFNYMYKNINDVINNNLNINTSNKKIKLKFMTRFTRFLFLTCKSFSKKIPKAWKHHCFFQSETNLRTGSNRLVQIYWRVDTDLWVYKWAQSDSRLFTVEVEKEPNYCATGRLNGKQKLETFVGSA